MNDNFDEEQLEEYENALYLVENAGKSTNHWHLGNAHFTLYLAYKDGDVTGVDINMDKARDVLLKGVEYDNLPSMIELMSLHLDAHHTYFDSPSKENGLSGTELGKALGIEIDLMQGIDLAEKVILTSGERSPDIERTLIDLENIYLDTFDQTSPHGQQSITQEKFNTEQPFCHQNLLLQSRIKAIQLAEKQLNIKQYNLE